MPYGLSVSELVQSWFLLLDMFNEFDFICLDNIQIFSFSETEHGQHVRVVLQRLLQNQLYVRQRYASSTTVSFLR